MGLDYLLLAFVTVIGACVGSFLNVVIYRVPEGQSVVRPGSRCPRCGYALAWYDNVPVVSWLILRGRCRRCQTSISAQYPLVEAVTAVLFGGLYAVCYLTGWRPGFSTAGVEQTWAVFAAYLVLAAGLTAATVIDSRHFIIPLSITWTIALTGLVLIPANAAAFPPEQRLVHVYEERLGAFLGGDASIDPQAPLELPIVEPMVGGAWVAAALGAGLGLGAAWVLLITRLLPRSFDEPAADVAVPPATGTPGSSGAGTPARPGNDAAGSPAAAEGPEAWLAHPHPRREVLKEVLFLLPIVAGGALGYFLVGDLLDTGPVMRALGGVVSGYFVGGGIVWATRILGTLGFGKEAMGLGDVHLLAAAGLVLGGPAAVLTFFIAPFFGLAWAAGSGAVAKLLKREARVIPYGPHLAAAALVVIAAYEPLLARFGMILGQ